MSRLNPESQLLQRWEYVKGKDTHGEKGEKWIGFDLDGTLAEYNGWNGIEHIGKPIEGMCNLIKKLHSEGLAVKILTARVAPRKDGVDQDKAKVYVEKWCEKNLGFVPPITHEKDSLMETLYDDRVVQVIPNTGVTVEEAAQRLFKHGQKDSVAQMLVDFLEEEN